MQPLMFLDGLFSDELLDDAMSSNAEAFVRDKELKAKVGAIARHMFANMENSDARSLYEEQDLTHEGVTFKVACGVKNRCVDEVCVHTCAAGAHSILAF